MFETYMKSGQVTTRALVCDFDSTWDVVVVGLGTSGAIAAIVAAENGLRTLGLDRTCGMGGLGTLGQIWGYYHGSPGGIYENINDSCKQIACDHFAQSINSQGDSLTHGDLKAYFLEQRFCTAGGVLCYDATVLSVIQEGNRLVGLRYWHDGQIQKIQTRYIIDTTGNAEIARLAKCRLHAQRHFDNLAQPFSIVYATILENYLHQSTYIAGHAHLTEPCEFSNTYLSAVARYSADQGIKESHLWSAIVPGVREASRIQADENITFSEWLADTKTTRPIFYASSNLDNLSRDVAFESHEQQDWHLIAGLWDVCLTVAVPMGALIPETVDGLVVAGRSLGVDHDLSACVRMKRDLEKSGEAAAVMVTLAIQSGCEVRSIDYHNLAERLRASGCLDQRQDRKPLDLRHRYEPGSGQINWLEDIQAIKTGLASADPGIAMWSARRLGRTIINNLRMWLTDANERLRYNSALVLGMLNDKAACNQLRLIARNFDQAVQIVPIKYYYPDSCRAICLLGRLVDEQSVPWLLQIIEKPEMILRLSFSPDSLLRSQNDYYFQFFTQALVALIKIGKERPSLIPFIRSRLNQVVSDPGFSLHLDFDHTEWTEPVRALVLRI